MEQQLLNTQFLPQVWIQEWVKNIENIKNNHVKRHLSEQAAFMSFAETTAAENGETTIELPLSTTEIQETTDELGAVLSTKHRCCLEPIAYFW